MSGHAHTAAEAALGIAARNALRAPSIFNTQPWRWQISGPEAVLLAEPGRRLTVTDPDGRLLLVSLGAALHHAVVTVAAEGWTPVVSRQPALAGSGFSAPSEPDGSAAQVARLRLGPYAPTDPEAQRLAAAIARRRTDRRAFLDRPVPAEVMTRLRRAVEARGCYLHEVRPEQVPSLAAAVSRAAAEQQADPAYRVELDNWTHRSADTGDGVPAATVVDPAPRAVPMREFLLPGEEPGLRDTGHVDGAAYLVLFGADDDPAGWLRGGEALSALLLTAEAAGLAASPFSEAMEMEWPRRLLTDLLDGVGTPYLVVRVGYADPGAGPPPAAPRRSAGEVVDYGDR
ncbi:MAG TPA: nitroreductase [Actinoplanes sp.]|nr:nitroreductase [Actinoplanes sp.]